MKVTRCAGEGQGSCKRCTDKGKWNRSWMCFLYKIEGRPGCYCRECVAEIAAEESLKKIWADIAEDPEKLPNMVENLFNKAEEAEAEQADGGNGLT